VQGYFDGGAVPRQLGLDVIVQPKSIGPFSFGVSIRATTERTAIPGAFGISSIQVRTAEEEAQVRESSRKIAAELLSVPGFISIVAATIGDRMMTITAWDSPDSVAQLMKNSEHLSSIGRYYRDEIGRGGATGVWVPARLNPRRIRCTSCTTMAVADSAQGKCTCGATLPVPLVYW
jgi:hypothetical protein